MYVDMYMCLFVVFIGIYVCLHMYMGVCIYVYVCACVHVYLRAYVMYVYVYAYSGVSVPVCVYVLELGSTLMYHRNLYFFSSWIIFYPSVTLQFSIVTKCYIILLLSDIFNVSNNSAYF